jgi:hypothetical protein
MTTLLGIVGAFACGWVFSFYVGPDVTGFSRASIQVVVRRRPWDLGKIYHHVLRRQQATSSIVWAGMNRSARKCSVGAAGGECGRA